MMSKPRDSEHPGGGPAEFYRETVLRHSVSPTGFRRAIEATHEGECYNPLCGDRVTVRFRVEDGRIGAAAFDGEACAICLASASMLCAHAPGRTVRELGATRDWLKGLLDGRERTDGDPELLALAGVRRYPSRIRCALLPWEAAEKALAPDA